MRCRKCKAKVTRFAVIGGFKIHKCGKCGALQAFTPWALGGCYHGEV